MTVIATIITRHCTAHASDSFLTVARDDGSFEVVEDRAPKLVRVPALRGAIGYWGLSMHGADWRTLDWLRAQAQHVREHASAVNFGRHLAVSLTRILAGRTFKSPLQRGLGIHLTAYEYVAHRWVPELFLISNWTDQSYTGVRPDGFHITRATYATLRNFADREDLYGEPVRRLEVHAALHDQPLIFGFNNGDPTLFNPVADVVLSTFHELSRRGQLANPTLMATHLSIVRRPIEIVAHLVRDFAPPGSRLVGGRPHDLAVSPGGIYESTTGD